MAKYVIGLDGGGTKTELALVDMSGELLYTGVTGALNPTSEPESTLKTADELKRIVDADCMAICAACAGVADNERAELVKSALSNIYNGRIIIRTDGENALYTALENRDGLALISGTGSICYAKKNGQTVRTGGRGHVFDDGGSGYAIGRDILKAVIRAHDGRAAKTALSEALFSYLGTDDIARITAKFTSSGCKKADIASLSKLILQCPGDEAANAIIDSAATELFIMARAAMDALQLEGCHVALMGGIMLNYPMIASKTAGLIRSYDKAAACFLCDRSPAVAAAEYALAQLK